MHILLSNIFAYIEASLIMSTVALLANISSFIILFFFFALAGSFDGLLLGGCKFSGGIVEPAGVVLGAVSVSLISSMLTFMRVDTNYRSAVIGVILLISLAGGEILKRRKK